MLTQHMSQKSTLKFSDFAGLQLVQVTSYTSIDDRNLFLNSHGNCMEKKKTSIPSAIFLPQYIKVMRRLSLKSTARMQRSSSFHLQCPKNILLLPQRPTQEVNGKWRHVASWTLTVLSLFQELCQTHATIQQLLCGSIQIRPKLSKGSHFTVLSQLQLHGTCHLQDTGHNEFHPLNLVVSRLSSEDSCHK